MPRSEEMGDSPEMKAPLGRGTALRENLPDRSLVTGRQHLVPGGEVSWGCAGKPHHGEEAIVPVGVSEEDS